MADNRYEEDLKTLASLLNSNKSAIEVYIANFATPETLEAMRFWVQGELNRIQAGFTSTDTVVKLISKVVRNIINDIGEIDPDTGQATADHNLLTNRDIADQHPMSAISGLLGDQQRQDTNLTNHLNDTNNPHQTTHALLPDTGDPDQHPTSAITGLDAKQASQDDDIATRTVAGYGGIQSRTPTATTLDAGWSTLQAINVLFTNPIGVTQDTANNGLGLAVTGAWQVVINFTLSHNEAQAGRAFGVRAFNLTQGVGGAATGIAVGRNQPGTNVTLVLSVEVQSANDLFQIQIGGTSDSFTGVEVQDYQFSVVHLDNTGGVGGGGGGGSVPAGGTTGQRLTKASNADFDTVWETPSAGGGGGRTLIETVDLSVSGEANFTSIPQTYKKLILEGYIRSTLTGPNTERVLALFNGDANDINYFYILMGANSSDAFEEDSQESGVNNSLGYIPSASSPAGSVGVITATMESYASSSILKVLQVNMGAPAVQDTVNFYTTQVTLKRTGTLIPITSLRIYSQNAPTSGLEGELRLYGED